MARITIEECLDKIEDRNPFTLILVASEVAKDINKGQKTKAHKQALKSHISALREIEEGNVDVASILSSIRESKVNEDIIEEIDMEDSIIEENITAENIFND